MGKIKNTFRVLFVYLTTLALAFVADLYVSAVVALPVWFGWNKLLTISLPVPTISYCTALGLSLIGFMLLTPTTLRDKC